MRTNEHMICYQNQSISKLTFYLLKTKNLPSGIHILKQKHIRQPNYQLDLQIIGTSHALSLTTLFSTLTEIVACSIDDDDVQVPALNGKRLCETEGDAACFTDLRYVIDWEVQRFSQEAFLQQARTLHQRKDTVFSYEFPTTATDVESGPLTLIEHVCHPERVQIRTHHTYPDEFGIVVTRTQIELR